MTPNHLGLHAIKVIVVYLNFHPPGVRQTCPTWIFAEHQLHVHMRCFLVRSPAAKLLDADCKMQCGRTGRCKVNICGPEISICKCHHALSHNVVPSKPCLGCTLRCQDIRTWLCGFALSLLNCSFHPFARRVRKMPLIHIDK